MMLIKRGCYQDTLRCLSGVKVRSSDWDSECGLHQGQRSNIPRRQAGQMTATCDDQHRLKLNLAKKEPSTNDNAIPLGGHQRLPIGQIEGADVLADTRKAVPVIIPSPAIEAARNRSSRSDRFRLHYRACCIAGCPSARCRGRNRGNRDRHSTRDVRTPPYPPR